MNSLSTLTLISWRAMRAHATRLIMSILAVVLGTAFVAGGFLLSASLNKAFSDITSNTYDGVDVVVSAGQQRPLDDTDLAAVEKLAATDKVLGEYNTGVAILTPGGEPIQTGGAGAWLLNYVPADEALVMPATLVEGRAPESAGEATLNDDAAESAEISVGDTVTVIDSVGRTELEIVGLSDYPTSTGGWAGLAVTPEYYRENFEHGAGYFSIMATAAEGSTPEQLRDDVAATLADVSVQTGQEAADEQTEMIEEQLAFFTYILTAFGLIALLVGTFIISNTFSMTVGQRTRDFALLRALGMSRRQLTGSVLVEALFIGLIGSAIGIVVGLGLVRLIQWAMDLAGFGFPDGGLALNASSIGFPILVGILVTLISAYVPARRAGSTHPVQAMRGGESQTEAPVAGRTIGGAVVAALGVGALLLAAYLESWDTNPRMITTGIGAVLLLLGVLGMLSGFSKSFFSSVRVGGPVLRLAESSLSRNPGRTAGTVFALTMGVALVGAVTVLGASMSQSIYGAIEDEYTGDAVVSPGLVSTQGIPLQLVRELEEVDGVETVYTTAYLPVTFDADPAAEEQAIQMIPVLRADPLEVFDLSYQSGSFDSPAEEAGIVADESTADNEGWSVGEEVTLGIPGGGSIEAPVLAILNDNAVGITIAVSEAAAEQLIPDQNSWYLDRIYLSYDDASTHEEVIDLVNSYGVLQIMDRQEFIELGVSQAQQLLAVVYALLALSVVIAILGVANTLALSIIERSREIGSLRAVGMQRRQVWRMIMAESAQIAAVGAIIGVVLGTAVGVVLSQTMSEVGISEIDVPWLQLLAITIGAALIGTLAGLMPARRAARVSPLAAVE